MVRLPIRLMSYAAAAMLGALVVPEAGVCGVATTQEAEVPAPRAESLPSEAPRPSKPPAVDPSEAPASGPEQGLVGLDVFSSDGTRVGQVRAVSATAGGSIVALLVRTGGFLGFGGRTVSIPHGHFSRAGHSIRLDLNANQVSELPELKE